jgi:hypothetical protein
MTRQEIEAKISTIRNNNALPEKQKGMLLDKYERMLVDATIGDSDAGKIAPAKEKKARAPRTPKPKTKSISLQDFGRMTGIEVTDMTPKVSSKKEVEPDCDDLFEQDRERKAKAAIAAEKRRNAPKKTEATKNKEAVEKASAKVEKSVEKRIKSGDVSVAEIKKIIEEYETALKKLRQLLTRAEGKMKFGGPVKDEDISKLADKARDISNHHCGCNDKHEDGGSMYAGGGDTNSPQKRFLSEKQLQKYNHEKVGHIDFYSKKVSGSRYSGITKEVYFKDGFRPSFAVVFEQEPKEVYEKLKKWVKAKKENFDDIIAVKYSDGGSMYAGGGESGEMPLLKIVYPTKKSIAGPVSKLMDNLNVDYSSIDFYDTESGFEAAIIDLNKQKNGAEILSKFEAFEEKHRGDFWLIKLKADGSMYAGGGGTSFRENEKVRVRVRNNEYAIGQIVRYDKSSGSYVVYIPGKYESEFFDPSDIKKMSDGGSMYAGGGAIKIGDRVKSTTFKGISGTILSKNKAGYYFVRLDETLPNGDYQHEVLRIDEVEKMSDGGSMYAGGGVAEGGDFLESKGYKYPREVYFDLDGDSYQVTQAQKGLKDVAIYYYTHSFENPISKEVLNKFSKDFGNDFTITLFTNAGVDLHSSSKGKYKNITVKRISGNTYAGGGDTNEIVLTKPKDFVGKVLKNKKQIGTYRISASNRGTVYQVRLANETITFNNEKQIVKHLSQDQYAGGGNTERDAIEFFTDGGIGMKYIVNGKFDSVKFKTDMITRTSKPNAESTIKIWGREMGMNVSKYIDGEIIENIDFANDSTNRAKELFMAFNKKMATGGSMPKGWKHKMK